MISGTRSWSYPPNFCVQNTLLGHSVAAALHDVDELFPLLARLCTHPAFWDSRLYHGKSPRPCSLAEEAALEESIKTRTKTLDGTAEPDHRAETSRY